MNKGILLLLILVWCVFGTLYAQRTSKDSIRAHKATVQAAAKAYKQYVKAHTQRAYPDVTTISLPLISVIDTVAGTGITLDHMHFLDESGKYSVSLSFTAMLNSTRAPIAEYFDTLVQVDKRSALFIAPGFSWHPFGNNRKADCFIGARTALGYLKKGVEINQFRGYVERKENAGYFLSAVLIEGGLNFQLKQHFVFGLHAAIGPLITAGGSRGAFGAFGIVFGHRY